jgi:dsRNA-specific ribonuclease
MVSHFEALATLQSQRRSRAARSGLSLAERGLLSSVAPTGDVSALDALEEAGFSVLRCTVPAQTPPMSFPPKWAMEAPRRVSASIPALVPSRATYYSQALIHPSFVLGSTDADNEMGLWESTRLPAPIDPQDDSAAQHRAKKATRDALRMRGILRSTMRPLSVLGVSVLQTALLSWTSSSPHSAPSRRLLKALVGSGSGGSEVSFMPGSEVFNEIALAHITVEVWRLGDMVLVHGDLLQDRRTGRISPTSDGSNTPHSAPHSIPTTVLAEVVPAMIGAVYVDSGLEAAMRFAMSEVIPVAVRRYLQELEEESLLGEE